MTKNMEDLGSVSLAQSFVPFQCNGYQNSAAFQELLFMPNDLLLSLQFVHWLCKYTCKGNYYLMLTKFLTVR